MKRKLLNLKAALGSLALGACAMSAHSQTVLFQDDFETDTSANWIQLGESPNDDPGAPQDFKVTFNYDYSTNSFQFNGQQRTIPAAPNSAGGVPGTHGVRIDVNKTPIEGTVPANNLAGANIFPKDKIFSGNYALKFDMWIGYNGGAGGGAGSTEFALFGLNQSGQQVSWDANRTGGDGVWFAVAGEGGAARDFRSYEYDGSAVIERQGLDAGIIAAESADPIFVDRFPAPQYETAGAPGKNWIEVEVYQLNGNLVWKMNGYVIAERPNTAPATEGTIMLGAMDIFSSIATPGQDNFVIFDNVRVESLPATAPAAVSLAVTDEVASEPGTDTALLTVTRTATDVSAPLTVGYRISGGTATSADYETPTGTVTIPAGATEATIEIKAKNDTLGEVAETVEVILLGDDTYELRTDIKGQVRIEDDGDTASILLTVSDAHAYEKNTGDTASFLLTRSGDTSQNLTVNLQITGTAVGGTDYQTVPATVVFEAGVETVPVVIQPIDNATIQENRTVIATLLPGTGYSLGATTTGTVTIRNDDLSPASVVFSENFQTDVSENWNVNPFTPGNNSAEFGFDYSTVGIPAAPNTTDGSTKGLKLQANNGETGVFTGISVSPKDVDLQGDYRLRFDMWNNYVGPLPAGGTGSTMFFTAGFTTNSVNPQFPGGKIDGVLFGASGDGGTTIDYRVYLAPGAPLSGTNGVYAAGNTDAARNSSDPYYSVFGGRMAPQAQLDLFPSQTGATSSGALGMAWHEVVLTKTGNVATWDIDGIRIATVELTNSFDGNIALGYFDFNAGQSGNQELSFGLVDNVRVEQLTTVTPPEIHITATTVTAGQMTIRFTSTRGSASNFKLVSSADVAGPYTETAATINETGAGVFEVTVPATDPHRFFQVQFNQ